MGRRTARRLTHGGAIVVRRDGREPRFLLVQPSRGRPGWVVPKGRIEAGERALDTAMRETREEAGVATAEGPTLGTVSFDQRRERVRVKYFLLDYAGELPRTERRRRAWSTYREADRRLDFANLKPILRRAWELVRRRERSSRRRADAARARPARHADD